MCDASVNKSGDGDMTDAQKDGDKPIVKRSAREIIDEYYTIGYLRYKEKYEHGSIT